MDLTVILTGIGTAATISGVNIALISWLRSDMKCFETEIRSDMKCFETEIRGWKEEIQKESKDFHGRMERMDCEFKMRLSAIEERKTK